MITEAANCVGGGNIGSSPVKTYSKYLLFAAMLKLVARPACHAGVLWACEFKSRWLR